MQKKYVKVKNSKQFKKFGAKRLYVLRGKIALDLDDLYPVVFKVGNFHANQFSSVKFFWPYAGVRAQCVLYNIYPA